MGCKALVRDWQPQQRAGLIRDSLGHGPFLGPPLPWRARVTTNCSRWTQPLGSRPMANGGGGGGGVRGKGGRGRIPLLAVAGTGAPPPQSRHDARANNKHNHARRLSGLWPWPLALGVVQRVGGSDRRRLVVGVGGRDQEEEEEERATCCVYVHGGRAHRTWCLVVWVVAGSAW
jgi:hypothetical protein